MAKNLKGKTRKVNQPYSVYTLDGWGETRILKHYKSTESEKKDPYARVFCAVKTRFTHGSYDLGDVYLKDATRGACVYIDSGTGSCGVAYHGYELTEW